MQNYLATRRTHDNCLIVTLDDPSGASNRTTDQFKREFAALLTGLESAASGAHANETRPSGVIFTSAKSSFCIGGDVGQIMEYAAAGPAASFADSQAIKALFRRLETLGLPTVSCISGTAVGGGFELALACHARFCRDDDAVRLGFPEVNLGLVPGAGGMLRCVHLIGVDAAIPVLGDGVLLTPQQAMNAGLVTGLAASDVALEALACAWIAANPTPSQPWDRRGHAVPGGALFTAPRRYIGLQTRTVANIRDGAGKLNARTAALGCIVAMSASGFADGGVLESRTFARQACSDEARALIGLRIHDRSAQRRSGLEAPDGLAEALRAALDAEAALLLAEGVPAARIINAASHAGYAEAPRLTQTGSQTSPDSAPETDIARIGSRLLHAQSVAALRMLAAMSPEACQGVAPAINLAAVDRGNFPSWTGGPLRYAARTGVAQLLANAREPHVLPLTNPVALQALIDRAMQPARTGLETA